MKYCPSCRSEYVETTEECSDCKIALVSETQWTEIIAREQRARHALRDQDMEPICSVNGPVEAQSYLAALEQEGIPALLRSYQDTAFDGLFVGTGGWGQIWVAATKVEEATALVKAFRSTPPPKIESDSE